MSTARSALVFGASGQIGRALIMRLADAGWWVLAVSRDQQQDTDRIRWLRGELAHAAGLPPAVDAIFSCGPFDAFVHWLARGEVECQRVVAFGSTSVGVKRDSSDPAERDVADRLAMAEAGLFEAARRYGFDATLLRPTLVYGCGRDRNLTRIAHLARRLHGFALPRDALGLRQPVHVGDLAGAAQACVDAAATHGVAYDLPGGECLPYRDMVARVLAALRPPPRLVVLPPPVFRALLFAARAGGIARDFNDAALARMREDLVFDAAPASRDFGYAPRAFAPTEAMLTPPA